VNAFVQISIRFATEIPHL